MQPHNEPSANPANITNNNNEYIAAPPRYVHHDATMFKPIDETSSNDPSNAKVTSEQRKKFLSDNSKRRKVEELQRTIEFTDRLQSDADTTVFASKVAIGMETVSFGMCAFLANFGLRFSNPQQSVLRRFADTNLRLARMGSFYSLIGVGGMLMSLSYIPMEYQAIENANISVGKLERAKAQAVAERNAMLEEMAKAVGIDKLPPLDD